jgi:hypothetical protein
MRWLERVLDDLLRRLECTCREEESKQSMEAEQSRNQITVRTRAEAASRDNNKESEGSKPPGGSWSLVAPEVDPPPTAHRLSHPSRLISDTVL